MGLLVAVLLFIGVPGMLYISIVRRLKRSEDKLMARMDEIEKKQAKQ
ncbi:MAG: hypothetical protein RR219_09005 [Clostridiales bacterium]